MVIQSCENELELRYRFFKEESEKGNYHNPHEYDEEMTGLLGCCFNYNSAEWNEWEDKIHEVGMCFWEM